MMAAIRGLDLLFPVELFCTGEQSFTDDSIQHCLDKHRPHEEHREFKEFISHQVASVVSWEVDDTQQEGELRVRTQHLIEQQSR